MLRTGTGNYSIIAKTQLIRKLDPRGGGNFEFYKVARPLERRIDAANSISQEVTTLFYKTMWKIPQIRKKFIKISYSVFHFRKYQPRQGWRIPSFGRKIARIPYSATNFVLISTVPQTLMTPTYFAMFLFAGFYCSSLELPSYRRHDFRISGFAVFNMKIVLSTN